MSKTFRATSAKNRGRTEAELGTLNSIDGLVVVGTFGRWAIRHSTEPERAAPVSSRQPPFYRRWRDIDVVALRGLSDEEIDQLDQLEPHIVDRRLHGSLAIAAGTLDIDYLEIGANVLATGLELPSESPITRERTFGQVTVRTFTVGVQNLVEQVGLPIGKYGKRAQDFGEFALRVSQQPEFADESPDSACASYLQQMADNVRSYYAPAPLVPGDYF